jgi:hypothetical protein
VGLAASAAAPAGDGRGELDHARAVLEKWTETRRVISRERRDWALGRDLLAGRIELVQREIESLRARIRDAEASIAEADRKRAELLAQNESLKATSSALLGTVAALETRTRDLLRRLPDPIRERVKPLSQRIPEDPAATKLSLSERFQNVVGVLNEVNRFHGEITVTSEVRTLPDGAAVEVTALYVGIAQGYYASANGKSGGVGAPAPDGWRWTPADSAAPAILAAVAMLQNERVAAFAHLPVQAK